MTKYCKTGIRWIALFALTLALLAGTVPQAAQAATLCVDPALAHGCTYATIQAAIDAAAAGDTINIYPGAYDETAANRAIYRGESYTFGLFINKAGLILQGVKADGTPVSNASEVAASITTNATNNFGYSGVWVESDNVTIRGLEILDNKPSNNKTFEIIGDNFTLQYSKINASDGGSVYLNDWRYDAGTNTSYVKAYHILDNIFTHGGSVDVSSGAGYSGDVANRVISGNSFQSDPGQYWPSVSFNGIVPSIGWFTYQVGGAIITGNTFGPADQYIRYRGELDAENGTEFDFQAYFDDNSFPYAALTTQSTGEVRSYGYTSGTYAIPYARRISGLLNEEVDHALSGDTVQVKGVFTLPPTAIKVDEDITITGLPGARIETSGAVHYLFEIAGPNASGATLQNLEIFKTDKAGEENLIWIHADNVTIQNNIIHGKWAMGDGEVTRAMVVSGGHTGILVQNNTIYDLRQPAYTSGSMTIKDNIVYGTKGWVVENGQVVFTGNSWGDGSKPNAVDIALLGAISPANQVFYDIPAIKAANNNAKIDAQYLTTGQLTDVYVDASAPAGGNGYQVSPYNTIAPALDRVVAGGTIHIKNGAYTITTGLNITKPLSIIGESQAGVIISPTGSATDIFFRVNAQNVTLKNFTLDGNIPQYTSWPPTMPWYGIGISQITGNNLVTIENVTVQEFGKNGFNFNNAKGLTLKNLTAANNGGAGMFLTNVYGATIDGLTTSNNQWGGVAINIINKNSPTPTYGTDGIVFSGALVFNETTRGNGAVYLEEEYNAGTDPGFITYSFDGSAANVKFPAGLFTHALRGIEDDHPTRRVRFYTSVEWATAAGQTPYTPPSLMMPGHMLSGSRQLINLATGEVRGIGTLANNEKAILNTDGDGDNEIEATYTGAGTVTINLWMYDANPKSALPLFATPDAFYDIQVLNNTDPEAVLTVVMEATNGKVLRFWDGSRWMVVRNNDGSIAKAANGHLNLTFGPGSTPTLSQLSGTPVVASAPEAVEIQIADTNVQQNLSFTAQVVGKSTSLYGVQVFLTYDATRLNVTNVNLGDGLADDYFAINEIGTGTIQFAYSQQAPKLPVSGDEIVLATITFQAKGNAPLGAAAVGFDGTKETIFADANGFALGVYPTTLSGQGDSINVTSRTIVSGQVTRQGRVNFAGTTVDLNGPTDPAAITTGASGTFSFDNLVSGLYDLVASYKGYLTARLEDKDLKASPYTVPAVMLLGGDADHNGKLELNDLSVIGRLFLDSALDTATNEDWADINEDGTVNILDLVMAGSNYGKTSTPWSWTPAP